LGRDVGGRGGREGFHSAYESGTGDTNDNQHRSKGGIVA